MKRHGYISDEEYALAKSIKVEDLLIDPKSTLTDTNYQYQAYIDEAVKEAQKKVKYVLEKTLTVDVNRVNVFVQGVRVNN